MLKGLSAGRISAVISPRAVLGHLDPMGLAGALARVGAATVSGALPRRMAGLGKELATIAVGRSSVAPQPKDWRFQHVAWSTNPAMKRLCQSYLAWSTTAQELVADAGLDWRTAERAKLGTALVTSALAPTNVWALNPEAVEEAYRTGGLSILRGLTNLSKDLATNRGLPRSASPGAFVVGRDLAVTPGAVVYRNEVLELLQYVPTTPAVHALPVVMVPPQINKYYFMDMAPGRSFVEYVVSQGFSMFTISWRNPTEEHRHWNLDTYVGAVREAVRVACEITGSDEATTVSLCAGGITTAALLGHLAATQDHLIRCATFAVTLLDFSVPSMIGLFGTPSVVRRALAASRRAGTAGGLDATVLFASLRPNDLIWNYWVRNNLLGQAPRPFDVLAWNADATRLPAALHADFLDMFLNNSLASGAFPVFDSPVDLAKVECDTFVVAAQNDHLTDWKACYATTQLFGGQSRFALSSSGHIQSLVNPPGNPKMTVTTGAELHPDPGDWLAEATAATGSWWEHWATWAAERSGELRPAPTELGSDRHPPLEAAPGSYVHAR